MLYEIKGGKIFTRSIEYSVSYHCNLRCAGCSHLSPYVSRRFPSVEGFAADVNRLTRVLHAKVIRLLGGEPLLNPEIQEFIKVAKESGIADHIMVTTNGSQLHKMGDDFWKNLDFVLVTLYPNVHLKESYSTLKERARVFDTKLWFHVLSTFRTTIVTMPHRKDWITEIIFRTCRDVHLFHCHMIHEGKLYKCAVPPFLSEYAAKLGRSYDPAKDAFDLQHEGDLYTGLLRFLTASRAMDACRYCLGYLGKIQSHHQLSPDYIINPGSQEITRKLHLDRRKFMRECAQYYRQRIIDMVNGAQM